MKWIIRHIGILLLLLAMVGCGENRGESNTYNAANIQKKTEIEKLLETIHQYPDSLQLRENLITYYRNEGNYDKAIATADEVLKRDSSLHRFWDIKAILYFDDEDTANAIRAYEKAIEIYPAPEYVMSLGSMYAETKNPKALEMADALLLATKAKAEKEALFIKGLYFNCAGNKQKAIEFLDKCINLDYNFMLAYREKAIALYDLGKYDEALQVLNKAVTLQNNFDEGYYWKGRCLEMQKKISESIEEYKTALFYNPDFIEAKDALKRLGVK